MGTVWSTSYAGKMIFPRWSPEYFRWQFRWIDDRTPENLIAAYEGDALIGVLLGTGFTFRSQTKILPGAQWSWLSIHPDYRGRGIAKALDNERIRQSRDSHAPLIISFRFFGSKHSQAEQPPVNNVYKRFHSKVGNWVRVLDAARFANWTYSRLEALGARCTVPLAPRISGLPPEPGVRDYSSNDLDACLTLVRQSQSGASLWIDWSRDQLAHQLHGSQVTHTLVLQNGDAVEGMINFHLLPFQSRTVENVGIIDLLACGNVSHYDQTRLIRAAMTRMAELQAILVIKPRLGETPVWPLVRLGFVPQLDSSYLVLQSAGDPVPSPPPGPVHLLWR